MSVSAGTIGDEQLSIILFSVAIILFSVMFSLFSVIFSLFSVMFAVQPILRRAFSLKEAPQVVLEKSVAAVSHPHFRAGVGWPVAHRSGWLSACAPSAE